MLFKDLSLGTSFFGVLPIVLPKGAPRWMYWAPEEKPM